MNYLSAENLSQAYGDKVLFTDFSFGVDEGQKVALIGVNGCGKSTLLKIMAGLEAPDSGKISYRKGIRVRYLAQEPIMPPESTVAEVVFSADQPAMKLVREYESLLQKGQLNEKDQSRLDAVISEIDAQGAWDYEHKIQGILSKLEVDFLDRKIGQLSGGQQKRVAIAQVLIEEPELLIMDEPTNHLDLHTIEWLEKYLSTSRQSVVLVTHDRYFLDSITNYIWEMDQGNLYTYKGDYAYFLDKKDERETLQDRTRERAASLYKTELEWLRRSPKARTTKSRSRIESAQALGEKAHTFRDKSQVKLQVKGRRIGGKVMEIKKLRKSFGDLKIIDDFTYTFNRRERIGIAGPNGVGKTTFINMLLGNEPPDSGKIRVGETIVFGYYKQSGLSFKPNQRVIEVVTEVAEEVEYSVKGERISAATLLEYFLFPRSAHSKRVESLSGGEKRRLHLLKVLMTNPNFLILDEPTNDLDLVTLRRLEDFLLGFEGCLMVVSHDRYFMDRLVDHLFVFEGDGKLKDYPGSYSQYQRWKAEQVKEAEPVKITTPKVSQPKADTSNKKKTKLSYKEKREFESLEKEIEALETKKNELTEQLKSGETDYTKLTEWTSMLEETNAELEEKSDRWLALATSLE